MLVNTPTAFFHSNKYCQAAAYEHCSGVVRHESCCITHNSLVYYAYDIVLDAEKLTLADQLILHALGATWTRQECSGTCAATPLNSQPNCNQRTSTPPSVGFNHECLISRPEPIQIVTG
jgi:hypothetical protein